MPLEPRARLLPEERLEAYLLLGDPENVEKLIVKEQPGLAEKRKLYLYKQAPARDRRLVEELQELYKGQCQICMWHPQKHYGHLLCHGHHILWISRGGEDALANMMLVCPNHHGAIHKIDAPFDFSDMAFDFGTHRENLQIDLHLTRA